MKKFIENSSKGDFYHTHLSTITNPSYISLFSKLTNSITGTIPFGNHQNSPSFFHLPSFLESATNPEQQTFGNEPLPPSALPLALKEATTMRKAEYDCLLKFYKIEYDDETLCSAKTMLRHRIFANDRIQKIASINLLRQVYKGGEGLIMRGSYIQAKYIETNNNSKGIYAGCIKYLFTHNFTLNPIYTDLHACHNPKHVFAFIEWYQIPCHQPKINQGIKLYDAAFLKYDYDNILPVHRILSPIPIGSHVSGSGTANVIVIPLPRKLYA
ncbi:hypothetical protein PHYBLDRAFT_176270 [Phycomyces blakesleeanus NRRL 1555(-)]|uniref:Uncharacterized protein n=1 Tax=Phycomyces blakesleeanus (strain ATCC 8743b / DSM 1359 / FGSC 10004 / NBRC 33097 / NRRL 1555) TaxID=763407 RepID=A0A167J7D7_PHYB8|nr:hypothetical protein PHYBLDRAFT_176270 [Phycomyces blakesleeanus NRRL 1555(-)]OAD65359.1 hypothetical protein PHYBLDRAFT_176270 [Phycomyces blakesleeanus NRRL 1555(-)]|eukprot:XP_018283399.1 hypothetical protein PHYBLDRAFT_176270 [Phycomyces blakesleeanus NRRL 1555(-)]